MQAWRACWALSALICASAVQAAEGAQDWIRRMNAALLSRNYDGVLVHQTGGKRFVLHIVHRVQDGKMNERVAVVPGPGPEFVRDGNEWIAYYPEQGYALLETRNRSYGFLTALNGLREESSRYYAITDRGQEAVEAGPARKITIEPRDTLRYGYRFWLDVKTALPLKSQLITNAGDVIEEIAFVNVTYPKTIADEQLKPAFDTSKLHWMRRDLPMYAAGLKRVPVPHDDRMPGGFGVRQFSSAAEEAKAPGPRTRFIVSDGISWVSVFIEKSDQATPGGALGDVVGPKEKMRAAAAGVRKDGVVLMGTQATYSTTHDGFKVTVVGAVPPATVKAIAQAVGPE
jgi:sigma-E factor negative regulatory protein RseB